MTAPSHDVTVRGGRISTERETFDADIGINDGVIVSIEKNLPPGRHDIDASGRWVLPGGIDSHVHIEQLSGMGMMCADDFYTGTVSAAPPPSSLLQRSTGASVFQTWWLTTPTARVKKR
jgi:dihydroorotase-like cyclic amidohydrolase